MALTRDAAAVAWSPEAQWDPVSVVSPVPETEQKRYGIRAACFYVDVTTARLNEITELFDSGKLVTDVGTALPLEQARVAHEMLGGAPHKRGKIVLRTAA